MSSKDLASIFIIQKQYLKSDDTWSDWIDAFTFGDDIVATNDFYDVVDTCYSKAYSQEELCIVPHRWRVFDFMSGEVVECSKDVNFIHLSEFGSYDTCGTGEMPHWIEGSNRNIQENVRISRKLLEEGLLEENRDDTPEDTE